MSKVTPARKRTRSKRYVNRSQQFKKKTDQDKEQVDAILAAARNKIKVSGLPRFYTLNDPLLQSFLKTVKDDLKLNVVHTRFSKKGNAWLYLSFATEEEQIAALEKLKRFTWQGRTLISTFVTTDELKLKRGNTDDISDDASAAKKAKIEIPFDEQVLMSQIPFYSIDYEEQLSKKHEEANSLLARMRDLMVRQGPAPKEWCEKRCKELESDIPFVLDKIRPCPMINEYRNKFDFIVGYKPHLETYGVGVRVKDADDGTLQVGPIDELRNLPKPMIQLAKIFDGYINKDNHMHWLCFSVRKNSFDEYMVMAGATNAPKSTKNRGKPTAGASEGNEEPAPKPFDTVLLEQLKKDVTELFQNVDFCKLKSIYLETERGRSRSDHDLHHLWGEKSIKERLHDLEIEISPLTFFRQNSLGTEVLCSVVEELAGLTEETTLLDLFCGSGSLSLTLAKKCKHVIGVEVLESNLNDAKKNAEINGIKNCEFIAGKIEDQIESIMSKLQDKEVVVVLDPPRSGIHAQIVKALRNFPFCKRFVYVCSNHKLPFRNLLDLSSVINEPKPKNKAFNTDPFIPVRVIPVDMTPHSLRSELVIQCDRLPKAQFQNAEPPKSAVPTGTAVKTEAPAKQTNKPQPKKNTGPATRGVGNRGGANRGVANRGTANRGVATRGVATRGAASRGGPTRGVANRGVANRGVGNRDVGNRGGANRGVGNRGVSNRGGGNRFNEPTSTRGPAFMSSPMNNDMYIDSIRDIERRAYEEGLVKGLERSAYQMGLAQGMNKPSSKMMDWEESRETSRPSVSSWNNSSSNLRNWDAGTGENKWSSAIEPSSAANSRFRDSSTPNPWSNDFSRDVTPGFGKTNSSSFFSERSPSRDWNVPNPGDFGFSSSRNVGSSNPRVWESSPNARSSFGDSFANNSWSGMKPFSSGSFNGESNRPTDRFNSSINSNRSSFSSNGFGNNSGFKSPFKSPSKARGDNNPGANRRGVRGNARRGTARGRY